MSFKQKCGIVVKAISLLDENNKISAANCVVTHFQHLIQYGPVHVTNVLVQYTMIICTIFLKLVINVKQKEFLVIMKVRTIVINEKIGLYVFENRTKLLMG
jgi:hypothetical protein